MIFAAPGRSSMKKFDAVKTMRQIRDMLSKQYKDDPDREAKDLEKIRSKYHLKAVKS